MATNELVVIKGRRFHVWRARLRDEINADRSEGNPLLWFAEDLDNYHDLIVCGLDQMTGACDLLRRAYKLDFHRYYLANFL